jgi:molybdopterin-guanine dinucleotide biosynthesis protein A
VPAGSVRGMPRWGRTPAYTLSKMGVSAAVLAGGKSRRLGRDKAVVEVGGQPLLARVVGSLAWVSSEILVVGRSDGPPLPVPVRFFPDIFPGRAALGGLYTALSAATYPLVIVVGCDMPFLNPDLLRYLVTLAEGFDAVVPLLGDEPQPLHAVYTAASRDAAADQLGTGDFKLARFLGRLRVRFVPEADLRWADPELRSFFNINTPADLELARAMAGAVRR